MDDLIAWLRAQLAEDEYRYIGAGRIAWLTLRDRETGRMDYTTVASATITDDAWIVDGKEETRDAVVQVVFDEREALADIEAKRRILDEAEYRLRHYIGTGAQVAFEWQTVRLLAYPYRNRPGYRPEWSPES